MAGKLHCIACGAEMINIMEDRGHQPDDGLSFHTYGHYGSTFFDLLDGSFIQIAVCDRCLVAADAKGWIDRPNGKNPAMSWSELASDVGDEDMEIVDGPAW